MITPNMTDDFMSVNVEKIDAGGLADISMLELDNALPKEKRPAYVLEK